MLKLHFAPNSRAVRILWLLEELELPFKLNKMAFSPKDLKSEKHRSRHPLGRVPVLEDGETILWESGAITEYILERHKNGGLKPPTSSDLYAEYLQWFHYCEGMVMPPINTIVVHTMLLPPERQDANVRGQAERLLAKTLKPVNDALEGREYLIGDFSGADIMLGHALFMSHRMGQIPSELTNISHYVDRLMSRPALMKATSIS